MIKLNFCNHSDHLNHDDFKPVSKYPFFSRTKFRVNAARMCEILIGRSLAPFEKEVFLFPRACRVCRLAKKEGMKDCGFCASVTYCSDQCMEENLEKHKEFFCSELKYAMVCDNYESTISIAAPGIPEQVDTVFKPLEDMKKHLKFNPSSKVGSDVDPAEMEFRFLCDRLTGPLTILHSAEQYGLAKGKRLQDATELRVHIVGSNIIEMLGIIKWEYIVHRLPKLMNLHLVFIGKYPFSFRVLNNTQGFIAVKIYKDLVKNPGCAFQINRHY